MSDKITTVLNFGNGLEIPIQTNAKLAEGEMILAKDGALMDAAMILNKLEQENAALRAKLEIAYKALYQIYSREHEGSHYLVAYKALDKIKEK